MDLVQPWLVAVIGAELGKALEWRDNVENLHLPGGQISDSSFEDDGSNLRIKPAKLGRVLQLIKFVDYSEPVKATLSDSMTRINVSFATTASRQYEKETRQRISQGSLGGVLQLLDFELVATPYGPRPSRLMLFIRQFKMLGSAGSGVKGMPRPIEDFGQVSMFLEKLSRQRKGLDQSKGQGPSMQQSSPRTSAARSPLPHQTSPINASPEHHVPPFATQLPYNHIAQKSSEFAVPGGDGPLIADIRTLKPDLLKPKILSTHQAKPQAFRTASNANLISLLDPNRHIKHSVLKLVDAKDIPTTQAQASVASRLEASSEKRDTEASSSELESPRSSATFATAQTIASGLPPNEVTMTDNHAPIPNILQDTVPVRPLPKPSPSDPSATLDNGNTIESGPAPPRHSSNTQAEVPRKRHRRNRITIRDIRISNEQEKLLGRSDSWLPAEPGQREPVANVPISILNALNKKADGESEPRQLRGLESPSLTVNNDIAEIDVDSDVEPDEALPWSSSPEPELSDSEYLPPDSSANQSDCVATRPSSRDRPDAFHNFPQHSIRSFSADLATSDQNLQITTTTPKPNGVTLTLVSTNSSSNPSPGVEETRLYRCRGCKESYTSISDLTSHVRDVHGRVTSPGAVTRPESPKGVTVSNAVLQGDQPVNLLAKATLVQHNGSTEGFVNHETVSVEREAEIDEAIRSTPDPDARQNSIISHDILASPNLSKAIVSNESTIATEQDRFVPPSPTSPGSEPESKTPRTMEAAEQSQVNEALTRNVSSTASQPDTSFTQIRRTPYVNGCGRGGELVTLGDRGSSPDDHNELRASGTSLETSGNVTLSGSTAPEVSSTAMNVSYSNGLPVNERVHGPSQDAPTEVNTPKRKAFVPSDALSRENKRPKFSEFFDEELLEDGDRLNPTDTARHYRREFFTSRRTSASVPAKGSPICPRGGNVGTFPESVKEGDHEEVGASSIHLDGIEAAKDSKATVRPAKTKPTTSYEETPNVIKASTKSPTLADNGSVGESDQKDVRAGAQEEEELKKSDTELLMNLNASPTPSVHVFRPSTDGEPTMNGKLVNISSVGDSANARKSHGIRDDTLNLHVEERLLNVTSGHDDPPDEDVLSIGMNHDSQMDVLDSDEGVTPAIADTLPSPGPKDRLVGNEVLETGIIGNGHIFQHNLFDRFKASYPDYFGDLKHFKALCTKINKLVEGSVCLPHFLWDDFIIRQKTEYTRYVQTCAEEAEDPLTYEKYYLTMIDGPKYTRKVVTARTLDEANGSKEQKDSVTNKTQEDANDAVSGMKRLQPTPSISQLEPSSKQETARRVTIDLTADDEDDLHSSSFNRVSTLHRTDARSKQAEPNLSSNRSPHVEASRRRRESHQTSTRTQVRNAGDQQRLGLGEEVGSTEADLRVQDHDVRYFRRRIHIAWDIEAEDVLGPEFIYTRSNDCQDKSIMSKKQLKLLAKIAESTDLKTCRFMLQTECQARAMRKPDGLPPELTDEILVAVREKLLSKPADHSRISPELGDLTPDGAVAWWQDKDTPFKNFVRNFESVQPARDNSYAKPEDVERGKIMQRERKELLKEINVFNWHV